MKNRTLQDLVAQLGKELQRAEDVDIESRKTLQELNSGVEHLPHASAPDVDDLLERIKALETRFAADHPTIERLARELADTIAKMGI